MEFERIYKYLVNVGEETTMNWDEATCAVVGVEVMPDEPERVYFWVRQPPVIPATSMRSFYVAATGEPIAPSATYHGVGCWYGRAAGHLVWHLLSAIQ